LSDGLLQIGNVLEYKGKFLNGLFHGEGGKLKHRKLLYDYEGSFFLGMKHGKGILTTENYGIYEGDFVSNMFSGKGLVIFENES